MSKKEMQVPEGWVIEELGSLTSNESDIVAGPFGSNLKTTDYIEDNEFWVPILRLQNIKQERFVDKDIKKISDAKARELSYHSFSAWDIAMAKLGDNVWESCVIPSKFGYGIVVSDVVRIRTDQWRAKTQYVIQVLNHHSSLSQLKREVIWSTRQRVNLGQIRKLLVRMPSRLWEQQKIASILSELDQTIEKTERLIEKYERLKMGLMEDLFTKGIELATGKPYTKFQDTKFGRVPEGWTITTLWEISENIWYGVWASAIDYDGKNTYLRITDIDDVTRKFKPLPLVSPNKWICDRYKLGSWDIVFARTGASVWKTYLYDTSDWKLFFAGFLIRFTIKKADAWFVFYQTLRADYKNWVFLMSQRSGQPGINAEEYKGYKFPLPTIKEQQKIESILSEADAKIEKERLYRDKLQSLKKGLMEDLLTGKVQVKLS